MSININEIFHVELTQSGADIWNASYEGVPAKYRPAPVAAGHVIKAQLWAIMKEFGPHTFIGMAEPHFKNCVITRECKKELVEVAKKASALTLDYAALHFDGRGQIDGAYVVKHLNDLKSVPLDTAVITGK